MRISRKSPCAKNNRDLRGENSRVLWVSRSSYTMSQEFRRIKKLEVKFKNKGAKEVQFSPRFRKKERC